MSDRTEEESDEVGPVAQLVVALDTILFEITRMENVVRDAALDVIPDDEKRTLRAAIDELWLRAEGLMTWVSDRGWDTPKN